MKKVAIVGGGEIGAFIAERLTSEQLDVTVIDRDPAVLAHLQNTIDVAGVLGNATSLNDLRNAEIDDADLFIATTRQDETNVMACLLAQELRIPHRIAVTRYLGLRGRQERTRVETLGIDMLVNSSEAVVGEIMEAVETTGPTEVTRFAQGRLILIGYHVDSRSDFAGQRVRDVVFQGASRLFYMATMVRDGVLQQPGGDTLLRQGDYLYLVSTAERLQELNTKLAVETIKTRNAVIYGDNFLSEFLANSLLNRHFHVTMLARDEERARLLTSHLSGRRNIQVEVGEGTELRLLRRVKVPETSVFIAARSDDPNNLTACVVARHLGVGKTIALIQRQDMVGLARKFGVDVTIAPRLATAKVIQKVVHEDRVMDFRAVSQTDLEVIELEARKDSRVVKSPLGQLKLPVNVVIGGLVNLEKESVLPQVDYQLQPGESALVLTPPESLVEVEALFGN